MEIQLVPLPVKVIIKVSLYIFEPNAVTLENTEIKVFEELLHYNFATKLKALAFLHFFIFGQPVNTFFLFLG